MSNKKNVAATPDGAAAKTTKKTGGAENASPEKEAVRDDGFCVYIGPSITGVIQTGTVYSGNKEKAKSELSEAIKKFPLIEKLIVTNKALPEARIKVKTPGNILYVNYHKLAAGRKN